MNILKTAKLPILLFVTIFFLKWQVLQLVAWTWMLFSFSFKHGPLTAWEMTFGGDFPCPLCQLVQNGGAMETRFWSSLLSSSFMSFFAIVGIALAAALAAQICLNKMKRTA